VITCQCLRLLLGRRKLISPGSENFRGLLELCGSPEFGQNLASILPDTHSSSKLLLATVAPKVVLQPRGVNSRVGSFSRKERTGRLCPKGQLRTVVGSSLCSHGPDERGVDSLRGGHKKALGDFEQRPGKTINCGLIRSLREHNLNQTHGSGMTQVTCPSQRLSVGG
jgi:hypothetical protein